MKQRGFTLLEILIALAIFALLSAAMSGQTRSGIRAMYSSDLRFDAQLIAENYAEAARDSSNEPYTVEEFEHNGRRWRAELKSVSTARSDMQKLTIRIYSGEEAVSSNADTILAELISYPIGDSQLQ